MKHNSYKIIDDSEDKDMYKTVVFDFDGVIHSYKSGWCGIENINDPPVDGIKECIDYLRNNGYIVTIVSSRCNSEKGVSAIIKWLNQYNIIVDYIESVKPPALVYIDDRAICFDGNSNSLINKIQNFKSWTEK